MSSMSFLDDIAREGLETLDAVRHPLFARAFRDSLTLDARYLDIPKQKRNGQLPQIFRADQIASKYDFEISDLRKLRLCLTRPQAHSLVNPLKPISLSVLLQKYDSTLYRSRFGRKPIFLDSAQKQMILTFAEWLHLLSIDSQPIIPARIKGLL